MLLFIVVGAQGKGEDDAKDDAKAAPPQIWQAIHSDVASSRCSNTFSILCLAFPRSVGRKANIAPPLQGIIGNIFVSVNNQHETSPGFFLYDTIFSKGFVEKGCFYDARPPCILHRWWQNQYLSTMWIVL